MLHGRRYNEGMHQAIEAKEKVEIKAENQTLGHDHAAELLPALRQALRDDRHRPDRGRRAHQIYKLGVVPIPTNQPMVRDRPGRPGLQDRGGQVRGGRRRHRASGTSKGQPVLVGTASVERPSTCPSCSPSAGIPHDGAQRQAPRAGGGDRRRRPAATARSPSPPTWPAAAPTSCSAATPTSSPTRSCATGSRPGRDAARSTRRPGTTRWSEAKAEVEAEAEEVASAGGLYVLGTERHESRRIDNQLRGRSGRQGDPGESRFYLSLGDELMRRFNGAHGRVAS